MTTNMRVIASVSLGVALVAAGAGTVDARPVLPDDDRLILARDPPPPPPPPPPDPPRRATMALASGGVSFASDAGGPFERFGPAAGIGFLHLSHREEPGFEAVASAAGGERGRSYALAARLVLTPRLRRTDGLRPFFAVGFAFATARLADDAGKEVGAGLGVGPSAALGFHGFVSHRVYWRAGAGFVGAGIGTYATDLSLGWVIGK